MVADIIVANPVPLSGKTLEDISDLSGVKTSTLMDLRKEGKSLFEIMELVKENKVKMDTNDKVDTNEIVDFEKRLTSEGFLEDDKSQTKIIVQRMTFSLSEITRNASDYSPDLLKTKNLLPNPLDEQNQNDDISDYKELSEKIDSDAAVYYTVKLQKDTGSLEASLNEYLYSIQIDADISLYISSKEEYEKQISEKGIAKSREEAITLSKIEGKMLEIMNSNTKMKTEIPKDTEEDVTKPAIEQPLPEINNTNNPFASVQPHLQPQMPKDPSTAAMDEMQSIINKSLN